MKGELVMQRRSLFTLAAALFVSFVFVDIASAYYNPRTGRFLSRDPIGEQTHMAATTRGFLPRDHVETAPSANLYRSFRNNTLSWIDPDGAADQAIGGGSQTPASQPVSKVWVCCRNTEFGQDMGCCGDALDCCTSTIGAKHCWLKTSTKEAGLGPAGGGAPEDESCPCCCAQTSINDHSGQCNRDNATCFALPGCDEACVNRELQVGKNKGTFGPVSNNCNTLVYDILKKCNCKNKCLKWETRWKVYRTPPIGAEVVRYKACVKWRWNNVPQDYPVPGERVRY